MRIVILRGPDQFSRDLYTRLLMEALEQVHGEIDQFAFDGTTAAPATVLDELRSFGLLHAHKLVVVDNADQFLAAPKDDEKSSPAAGTRTTRQMMERYAEDPVESATLLLRAATWRPGKLDKAVAKIGAIVPCEAPSDEVVAAWCVTHCQDELECSLEPSVARRLVGLVGTDRTRLQQELSKLASYVGADGTIDEEAAQLLVGLSREEEVWALQSMLLGRAAEHAVTKLRELREVSAQPDQLITWAITDILRKLYAAARLAADGVSDRDLCSQLKLFGGNRQAVPAAARRLGPARAAQLLRDVLEADAGVKSGLGTAPRRLETLAVQIADTVGCARRSK